MGLEDRSPSASVSGRDCHLSTQHILIPVPSWPPLSPHSLQQQQQPDPTALPGPVTPTLPWRDHAWTVLSAPMGCWAPGNLVGADPLTLAVPTLVAIGETRRQPQGLSSGTYLCPITLLLCLACSLPSCARHGAHS